MLLTESEKEEWDKLVEERKELFDRAGKCARGLEELFGHALLQAMRQAKWKFASWGTGTCLVPADEKAERLIVDMAQEALDLQWHDHILISDGDEALCVHFSDGEVVVSLEFCSDDPDAVTDFARKVQLDIDLTDWAMQQRAKLVADLDEQIESLRRKRAKYT